MGTITSWNPLGHSRPVTGLLYIRDWCVLHYILSAVFSSQSKVNASTARPIETLVSECIYVAHVKREFVRVHAMKAYRGVEV